MNIRSHSSQPVIGYIIVVIALAGMICYSLLFWDDMPAQVITRQAAGRHGASAVPRGVSAAAMPATLLICTLLLMLMPLWNRLVGSTPLRPGPDQRQQTRIWTAILAMLSALLLTLHIGITDMCTGRGPQFPQLAAYGMAVTLIGLAAITAILRVRAHRAIVMGLALGGALVAALAHGLPRAAMTVGTVIMLGGIAAATLLPQLRNDGGRR